MNSMSSLVRDEIQEMLAYTVADIPNSCIKLDAMELPCQFPEYMQKELACELAVAEINRYPNPATSGLQQLLKGIFQIPKQAQIVLGNGSDELIQLIAMLLAKPKAKILSVDPSFVMYRRNAVLFGLEYIGVPLNNDFTLNLPAILSAIKTHQPALIFIAYPNNPTGVCFRHEDVQAIIDAAPGVIVIDEAYGSFSLDSFLPYAGNVEKLVVMRTLSKIGFAGLRLGYACGHPILMNELAKIVPPYNMNQLSLTAAKFALRHYGWVEEQINTLKRERSRLSEALSMLPEVKVFGSEANFLTIRVPDAELVFKALKDSNILIKNLHGSHPLLDQCLRLTVGTFEQNQQVLTVFQHLFNK
ncbi:histidinol-phosphate transaminase [Neisseria sp. P0008.S010]|uniref:histidinol-phosphate transaminase n=1 Tax=Neisseria sp. P0008.S010 TaxID=3436707 RepID=UPI003F812294